jgi:hypothetical protein
MFVRVVHETRFPLIVLERHRLALEPELLGRVRRELAPGFLLGMQAYPGSHPASIELAERLREPRFELSFYKLAVGDLPAADEGPLYEGLHLDSHPDLTPSRELLRVLVNLSAHPRRFRYAVADRWQLAERGVRIGRREFEPLELPGDVEQRVVEIPGRTETEVHALRFYASAVPHVGLNDQPEHFLVSFETLTRPGRRAGCGPSSGRSAPASRPCRAGAEARCS